MINLNKDKDLKIILKEIENSLLKIPKTQSDNLINQIIKANRIFLVAIGRVNLSLQCFGKRLSHLGFKVEPVGSLTEKPAMKKDLLIVASGSGESLIPLEIAKKAKKIGCKIFLITSSKKSSIRKLSDYVLEIKASTKPQKMIDSDENLSDSISKTKKSIQPMSTVFDQALHVLGDYISLKLIKKLKINKKDLWKSHANLE